MNLLPIAEMIENAGLGVQGETVFVNAIPAECPQGVLLRNKLQGTPIDYELPGYFKTGFQLIVRAATYQAGSDLIDAVIAALTINNQEVGPMLVRYMRPRTQPAVFPLSIGNLLEFSTDFDVVYNA